MKERKLNEHAEKAEWYYENRPFIQEGTKQIFGPVPRSQRNFARDCACIKRGFVGTTQEWKDLCSIAWNHPDPKIRQYSLLRITSYVALIPEIIHSTEPTPEEKRAKVELINELTSNLGKELKLKPDVEWERDPKGGWRK